MRASKLRKDAKPTEPQFEACVKKPTIPGPIPRAGVTVRMARTRSRTKSSGKSKRGNLMPRNDD